MDNPIVKCDRIGSQTLLGYNNCFGMYQVGTNHEIKIVNFYIETLEKLLKEYQLDMPIDVMLIGERTGVIADWRIPDEYYNDRICEVCCPESLLPIQQRVKHLLDVGRGIRIEHPVQENGFSMVSYKIGQPRYELPKRPKRPNKI